MEQGRPMEAHREGTLSVIQLLPKGEEINVTRRFLIRNFAGAGRLLILFLDLLQKRRGGEGEAELLYFWI